MTDITLPGATPASYYAASITGSAATYCKDSDLINPSANVLAMANCPVVVLNSGSFTVPQKFFGVSVQNAVNDPLTGVTAYTTRSHDRKSGSLMWKYIETADGVFDWTNTDIWVKAHYAAGRELVFTLYGTPTINANYSARPTEQCAYGPSYLGVAAEPSDMTKWSRFCTQVATRYAGKIKYYEVWNEPNYLNDGTNTPSSPGSFYFSGTFAKLSQMVRLANQAIKAVDATAKIISPPITVWTATGNDDAGTWLKSALAASDGATGTMKDWVDVIGVHLYLPSLNRVQDLPGMIDRITAAKVATGVSGLETWDTESAPIGTGGRVSEINDPKGIALLTRRLVVMAAKGIARTIYYQYDHDTMGFKGRQPIIRMREQVISDLLSGTVTGASMLSDGRVVYASRSGQIVI